MLNNVQIQRISEGKLMPCSPQVVQFLAQRVKELESQLAAQASAVEVLETYRAQGKRVTVSVEIYDTKGTSKRGHAATFAEAVEQVRAMMEREATDVQAKPA